MDKKVRERLKDAGWKIGSVQEFLELSDEEAAFVELKLALGQRLRKRRTELGLSQAALAKQLGSSQARVARMEMSDPSVSVDLLIRALLSTGVTRSEIARAIGS